MNTIWISLLMMTLSMSALSAQSQSTLANLSVCNERESELKQLIKKANPRNQPMNIWIVPPMGCPRCEGLIPVLIEGMRKYAPDEVHLVWMLKHTREELKDYLKQREFDGYTLWDVADGRVEQYVQMNIGDIQTPHYMRFEPDKNRFVHQISLLGSRMSEAYMLDVITGKEAQMRYVTCDAQHQKLQNNRSEIEFSQVKNYKVPGNTVEPLEVAISKDRNQFLFIDRFSWDVVELNAKNDIIRFGVFNSFNVDTFIAPQVPRETYQMLKSTGVLNNMLFSPSYSADGKQIRFSASIARLDFHDNSVDYYNVPVLLSGAAGSRFQIDRIIRIDKPDEFSIMHTYTLLHPSQPLMYVGMSKGWPSSGAKSFVDSASLSSPFRKDFYHDTPLFVKINNKGKNEGFIGSINPVYQKLRTGYYFNYTSAVFRNSTFYYSDGYSGKVYEDAPANLPVCDLKLNPYLLNSLGTGDLRLADQSQVPILNSIDIPVLQLHPDSQLNYILGFKSVFKDCITKFDLNDDYVLCLVYRDRKPRAILYNRKKHVIVSEQWVPEIMGDARLSRVYVSRDDKDALWLDALYLNGSHIQWASYAF